jgi:hypothetical protein
MRHLTLVILGLSITLGTLAPGSADAWGSDVHVQGHYRRDGAYVAPHYRSAPDGNRLNNWSTQGNVNPYTGQSETRDPYYTPPASTYGGTNHGSGSLFRTPRCSGLIC